MQRANQVAERYRHQYIGTEHILLGIVDEGTGLALTVLKTLEVDPQKVQLEVQKVIQAGRDPVATGRQRRTGRAKKVIEYSIEEAVDLQHDYVGTEHLLLGLMRECEGVAAQVLYNRDLRLDDVRFEVSKLTVREPESPYSQDSPASRVFQESARGLGRLVAQVRRALGVGRRYRVGSPINPVDLEELEEEIEWLTFAKEEAVAKMDFKRAAQLRDRVDELKRRRNR
jgi:ATP-dependent Clp protease ATP-binding subunit ClpA